MTAWLTFRLEAPLASFGKEPGNQLRGSADRPSKSAVLGLVGAALGVRRDDDQAQTALSEGYRVATRTRRYGTMVRDFHTYQSLPSSAGRPLTRADALRRREALATSITHRDYRADVAYDVALTAEPDARWTLAEIAEALARPCFTLWLGRKSCPLSAPLAPQVVVADDAREALAARTGAVPDEAVLAAETRADLGAEDRPVRRHRRLDHPLDRRAWHFAARDEFVEPWHLAPGRRRAPEDDQP